MGVLYSSALTVKRGPQLVAHRGDEIALGLIGCQGLEPYHFGPHAVGKSRKVQHDFVGVKEAHAVGAP